VVVAGGTVRLPDGTLAGSASSLLAGLRELVATLGVPVEEVAATCTTTPAALLGLGPRDSRTVLTADLELVATVVDGVVVHGAL
jgi:N-acetylglucosamine-6-phosphate deacetylase